MSAEDFDAAAAAARATGEDPEPVADDHQAAEGSDTDDPMGSTSRWREALMSTEPDPPLEQVDSPWDPEIGGLTRVYRGVLKIGGFNGTPAGLDIIVGGIEALKGAAPSADDDGGETNEPEQGGGGGEGLV